VEQSSSQDSSSPTTRKGGAPLVAVGIFLSRVAGFVRESVFAHYFGNSGVADAFKAAMRIPNVLQNLFGEGVLSASFIPVYSSLLAQGKTREADDVASAVGTLLTLCVAVIVLCGVIASPLLIDLIAPGFEGEKRSLAITLVAIFFPGTGLLVLSAWCLGVLNSHRRFLLSYSAPVIWNAAIISALVIFGARSTERDLAIYTCWGAVVGSLLQCLIQLPLVLKLMTHIRPWFGQGSSHVRTVLRNFSPSLLGRGVVQISAYIDSMISSLLPGGAVAALSYAQTLYLLPISVFGMSVSASELPAMAALDGGSPDLNAALQTRLQRGLKYIAFFVIPSLIVFALLGDVVIAAVFQSGRFSADDTAYVWLALIGSSVGLLAATFGRLFASTLYAVKDARTPFWCALARVIFSSVSGCIFALYGPGILHIAPKYGIVGLTTASGMSAWIEATLLKQAVVRRIGSGFVLSPDFLAKCWIAALLAALGGYLLKISVGSGPLGKAFLVFGLYGIVYIGVSRMFGIVPRSGPLAILYRK